MIPRLPQFGLHLSVLVVTFYATEFVALIQFARRGLCMQPSLTLVTAATPLLVLSIWSALPGQADHRRLQIAQLPPLPELSSVPATNPEPVWIKAIDRVALASIARRLELPVSELAATNKTSEGRVFKRGEWIQLLVSDQQNVLNIAGLDASSLRYTAPAAPLPPIEDKAEFRAQDTLHSFLKRHGLTGTELRAFNPGLDLATMTAGREVRITKAYSGQKLLAIRPSVSGGASWPDTLQFPGARQLDRLTDTYVWPTKGVFTSGYGWRWGRMHKGIDIANNTGTPIHAARDGIVSYAGWSSGYGYLVEIAHRDGESTRYAHNSRLLVKKGQPIAQGTRISLMGSTGRSTGPHLHFEIRRSGGAAVNPLSKLPARSV